MPIFDLDQLMSVSASEVLETMFFAGVLGTAAAPPENPVTTRLDFHGTPSGSFGLAISRDSSRQIAADFLAEDAQTVSQEQVNEVVCELTNMLCGSLLSRIETEASFELTHPELSATPDHTNYSRNFELEHGTLAVWLRLVETP